MTVAMITASTVLAGTAVASGAVSPVAARATSGVTADALPTVQIDGVVWSQAVIGNTVYAGGNFANARPAGAAAGTNLTPRANLLAYNLSTGALITSFAPSLNAQVKVVAASPDGSRLYVGGMFSTANGANRYRIAAYNTSTGALVTTFAPSVDASVNAITATNSTVYVGGNFTTANGVARTRLAAFSAATGALLGWAPTADAGVNALQLTPDGSRVIVAGSFSNVNSSAAVGVAALDATTGSLLPYAVNQVVKNYGTNGAILSLSTDGNAIYGSGYAYGNPSNFEGVFSVDPDSGAINWLADCHGDSYGAYGSGSEVYVVSHQHYCANIGGFPDTNPRNRWQRTTAFTTGATGTVLQNGEAGAGYGNFAGQPSPSLVNWFPDLPAGSFTGQDQAAWSVTGDSSGKYVVEGGEFPSVNGTAQQGLVRFAVPSIAPNARGPQLSGSSIAPTLTAPFNTAVTVSWPANSDQDDQSLTYSVYRSDAGSKPVYTTTAVSQFWNRPTLSYRDSGLSAGTSYTYWVVVTDPSGNSVRSPSTSVTTPTNAPMPGAPVAAFTPTCQGLQCTFDASASSDPDGTVASYAWTFGDNATGSGVTATHTYPAGSQYSVTLIVTDNQGNATSLTKQVTTTSGSSTSTFASDAFGRTVSTGLGSADVGGAWTTAPASAFAVGGGAATVSLTAPGAGPTATLATLSQADSLTTVDLAANKAATGSTFLTLRSRINGTSYYALKVRFMPGGVVHLAVSAVVGGTETTLKEVNIPSITYTPGSTLTARFKVLGSGASTTLAGSVWPTGSTPPSSPQVTSTDSTAALQGAGSTGVQGYLSASSTNAPVVLTLDNYSVTSG